MKALMIIMALFFVLEANAQSIEAQINSVNGSLNTLRIKQDSLEKQLEQLKLNKIVFDLDRIGLPEYGTKVYHSAMVLSYNEQHEQADWVAHMILPEVKNGKQYRTNDFRVDPKIATGTAIQEDYFLTDTLANGSVNYDGYGWDRGHLAPSSDYRWSKQAMSETYYYSNMSPQVPEFNRQRWADLESLLRNYVIKNQVPLTVITAPILEEGLPVIQRSIHNVSIPKQYVKIAYDEKNQKIIGFVMDNRNLDYPVEHFAKTAAEVEALIGYELLPNVSDEVKGALDKTYWFSNLLAGDVEPIAQDKLPRYHFNTVVGGTKRGQKATVCGKVVSARYSRKGHLWLNLDKAWPNNIFSIFIPKEEIANFSYDPKLQLESTECCFIGLVEDFNEVPTIKVTKESQVNDLNL